MIGRHDRDVDACMVKTVMTEMGMNWNNRGSPPAPSFPVSPSCPFASAYRLVPYGSEAVFCLRLRRTQDHISLLHNLLLLTCLSE